MKWISDKDRFTTEEKVIVGEYWYTEDSENQCYNYKPYEFKDGDIHFNGRTGESFVYLNGHWKSLKENS